MITAAAYDRNCPEREIRKAGFDGIEIRYPQDWEARFLPEPDTAVAGIRLQAGMLLEAGGREILLEALGFAAERKALAVIVETFGVPRGEWAAMLLKDNLKAIRESGILVCLENGCFYSEGRWRPNGLSGGRQLLAAVEGLNRESGSRIFGGSVHLGYANLLGLNPGEIILNLGKELRSVCLQDNDGQRDFGQLPYSFTSGRGTLTTPWAGVVRSLAAISFDGLMTVRMPGLFSNLPEPMVPVMLNLAKAVADEWREQIGFEKWLAQGKKRVLFGCGIRFQNYMEVWGGRYPPDLIADNNQTLWGRRIAGVLVAPPDNILKIPAEERLVLICNRYHIEIGRQLQDMGVSYRVYDDGYWGRYQQIGERRRQ